MKISIILQSGDYTMKHDQELFNDNFLKRTHGPELTNRVKSYEVRATESWVHEKMNEEKRRILGQRPRKELDVRHNHERIQ